MIFAGRTGAAILAALAAGACATAPAREPAAAPAASAAPAAAARPGHTAADVRFVQDMMAHHAQALVMTALVPERTTSEDMRLIAERIEVSQRDEIAAMRSWLARRGEPVPDLDAHQGHHDGEHGAEHGAAMPGMLTAAELARLEGARGAAFDSLFLESMIRHHEGALTMVAALLASGGAAQDPVLFGFASDVDADQRAEIRRMRAMQQARRAAPDGSPRR